MARPNASRIRILDAAVALAAEQGVTATSIDAIAARAEVAKGSVYYNFASKDELYATAFVVLGERFVTQLRVAREEALADDSPVEVIVRRLTELLFDHPDAAKFFTAELLRTDRSWAESAGEVRAVLLEVFGDAITAARARHHSSSAPYDTAGLDPHVTAVSLLGAVLITSLDALAFRTNESPEVLVATLVTLCRNAVGT